MSILLVVEWKYDFVILKKKYLYEEPNYPNLLLLCLKCRFYNFSDYSLSQAFGQYLTHAYGESAIQQLKGKICKIFSFIQYWFSLAKIHRNENILLIENYNGEYLHLISIRKSLGILLTIFNVVIWVCWNTKPINIIFLAMYWNSMR